MKIYDSEQGSFRIKKSTYANGEIIYRIQYNPSTATDPLEKYDGDDPSRDRTYEIPKNDIWNDLYPAGFFKKEEAEEEIKDIIRYWLVPGYGNCVIKEEIL